MEVSEDIRIGLANVKPTLHARWNPTARVLRQSSFDVNGQPRRVEHDPRWELWDTDVDGREYRVTVLEAPDGSYLPLGTWVLELVALINPANYDGDLHRMVEALVDRPNAGVDRIAKESYEELLDFLADYCWSEKARTSRIVVPHLAKV